MSVVSFRVNVWKCTGISHNAFVRGCFYNADSFFISLNCELSQTFPFSRLGFFSIITGFPPNVMTKIKSDGSATLLPVWHQIAGEVMILNWSNPEKEKGLLWWPEEGAKDPITADHIHLLESVKSTQQAKKWSALKAKWYTNWLLLWHA